MSTSSGDNCSTIRSLAEKLSARILQDRGCNHAWLVPLVGCNSHRLNLARQENYRDPVRAVIIEKVDNLMKSVRTLKNSSKLRKQTQLQPEKLTECLRKYSDFCFSLDNARRPQPSVRIKASKTSACVQLSQYDAYCTNFKHL